MKNTPSRDSWPAVIFYGPSRLQFARERIIILASPANALALKNILRTRGQRGIIAARVFFCFRKGIPRGCNGHKEFTGKIPTESRCTPSAKRLKRPHQRNYRPLTAKLGFTGVSTIVFSAFMIPTLVCIETTSYGLLMRTLHSALIPVASIRSHVMYTRTYSIHT